MSDAVGIDLGTTISLLAVADEAGRVSFARTRDGDSRLRSVVQVLPDGSTVVGDEAQRSAILEPGAVFAFFKRAMGTSWSVEAGGRAWAPEDLSAAVMRALVEDATDGFGAPPLRAVVTIPAYFGDDARRATQRAGERAGLDVLTLLHEPTAACLAHPGEEGRARTVLVYDLGGGTFDVSVVRFAASGDAEVLATAGDHRLGGKDWDDELVALAAERIAAETGADPLDDESLATELRERAREAKHALSRVERTAITLVVAGRIYRLEVRQAELHARTAPLFARTEAIVTQVLDDVGGPRAVDAVLLVGGSTRMAPCAEVVRRATGRDPRSGVDPDRAVAAGAALVAREAAAGVRGGLRAAGRGEAPGASGRGGGLRRVRDATAHALGFVVLSADGSRYVNEVMIPRNAPIPATATKRHRLEIASRQPGRLEVHMLQGEAERPLDAQPLGCWTFADVPGDGTVLVEVTYRYDEDGIVAVGAAVDGRSLPAPSIDRDARDLRWTEEDPAAHRAPGVAVTLAIDVSGSMAGRKLEQAAHACREFVDQLEQAGAGDCVALVSFGTRARRLAARGELPVRVRAATERLSLAGSTNMAAGLELAGTALGDDAERRVVVLVTDGVPDSREQTLVVRDRLVADGVEIVARGVEGADAAFLARLATGDGLLIDSADLPTSLRGIAQQLAPAAIGRRA